VVVVEDVIGLAPSTVVVVIVVVFSGAAVVVVNKGASTVELFTK